MRIAVIGLGRMGAPMARNLAEVGHQITLYNRTPARALELGSRVGRVVSSVAEAVSEAQVALTSVADDAAEETLSFGPGGLLSHLPAGAIHLCMSTIGVETSRRLAFAHEGKHQGYIAAPVFGRPGAAASRHLWIVAGGPDAQMTRCLPIFEVLGRGLTRVGPTPELAHAVKLGGSLLAAVMVEGLSEVLAFGEKAGLAPADFLRLLNLAIFKSPLLDAYGGLMVRHTFDPADLSLDQALRDTRLALQASEDLSATLPMADLLQWRLEEAAVKGFGAQDLSVLFRACRMDAGLEELKDSAASHSARAHVDPRPHRQKAPCTPSKALLPESPEPPLSIDVPLTVVPGEVPRFPGAEKSSTRTQDVPLAIYFATSGTRRVSLDLKQTSHFEEIDNHVWAWHQEKRYGTAWRSLSEVKGAFGHVLFLQIQRNVLLHPEAVRALKPAFGGRAKAKVGEHLELEVSRAAAPRLKELLGL